MLEKTRAEWKTATENFGSVRMRAICAMFIALRCAVGAVFIPVGENLRVYFTYASAALGASIYGPFMALAEGCISDLLGYMLAPSGGFFPGYTLSAMLGSLIYALFLYRKQTTVLRLFLCRLTVNLLINVALGSVWSAVLMGKGYLYYVAKSIVKNLLLLPLETLVMAVVFRTMNPLLERMKLIPAQSGHGIPLFGRKSEVKRRG